MTSCTTVQKTVTIPAILIATEKLSKKLSSPPAPVGSLLAQQSVEEQFPASASIFATTEQ